MQYHEVMHEIGYWNGQLQMEEFAPSPSLRPYIKSYQLLTGQNSIRRQQSWYILPDSSAHLIFYLYERKGQLYPSLRLVGPRTMHRLTDRGSRHLTLIASFEPGAIWYACKGQVNELTDLAMDASDILTRVDDELLGRMADAARIRDVSQLIAHMEQIIHRHLTPNSEARRFFNHFAQIDLQPLMKVGDMASQMGISTRHLRSLTQKYIGHSPKDFLQITRFTRSLIMSNQHREWPAIAVDAGFYDQSHMIATYQKMCGYQPRTAF